MIEARRKPGFVFCGPRSLRAKARLFAALRVGRMMATE
jgi:hypothetical protein